METTTLDTSQEQASPNGHDATWQTFDDDQALLRHILGTKPAEEIVDVPEWGVRVLCKSLNAETRIDIQVAAYDEKTKRTDYRKVFHQIVIGGCFNPTTGGRVFTESHRQVLMQQQDGRAVERLALAILRLSSLVSADTEKARKN